ncbi:MAG: CRISPR-associated helicase Cas3' [Acidilobaceae archaeon]
MLEDYELVFVFAPTSYGKTMASPYLLNLALHGAMANRLIHVVPVRALLREIYYEKFSQFSKQFKVGYQSMDRIPGGDKSPYFLSDITVTTLDSFLWNIYKIPVAEISKVLRETSMGHYYPALAAIQTSIVVFDEAHVYIGEYGEERERMAVMSVLEALHELRVPTVLSTATMSSKFVDNIIKTLGLYRDKVGVVYACENKCNENVRRLEDLKLRVEYVEGLPSIIDWNTSIDDGSKIASLVGSYCRDKVVLVIANTVDRAIELYRESKEKCERVALIHSRLVEGDKRDSYSRMRKIREEGSGLIVASPIVEVGVEVDADILITDEAPLENLIQRAGRLCRSRSGMCNAEVIILKNTAGYYPYDKSEVQKSVSKIEEIIGRGDCIEWRLFNSKKCKPAIDILDDVAEPPRINPSLLLKDYLISDARPLSLIEKSNINELFRSLSMIKVAVDISKCINNDTISLDCIERNLFATSIPTLRWLENRRKCLETSSGVEKYGVKVLILTAKWNTSKKEVFSIKEINSSTLYNAIYKSNYDTIFKRIYQDIKNVLGEDEVEVDFFVKIKPECYKSGEGAYV